MRGTQTVLDFLDDEYSFDESAFRAATIDNFPRVNDGVTEAGVSDGAADD